MPVLNYLTTTHFDYGAISQLAKELARLDCKRPLIATDAGIRATGILARVVGTIERGGALPVYDATPPNPTEAAVLDALDLYRREKCDGIVALGGGSSMDLGKAVALLAGSDGPLERFDPAKGGAKHIKTVAPVIAVPTTAGTGSEVSVGFVIVLNDGRKATFASPRLIPSVAICDPELTLGLPPLLTAATGMDAITHCIEAVLSPVVNPPAEGIGLDGLWRGWRHIKSAVADGSDRDARWHMMMASTEGALAFVKGLGAVHAMSHAAGRIPDLKLHHGTLNAVILPTVLRFNQTTSEEKYGRLAQAMGLKPGTDLAAAIETMNRDIGLPLGLRAMGVDESMVDELVRFAATDLASRSNPRPATPEDYRRLFAEAM
jgi:alcohol dehydrogenase class IV